jgi:Xaa-Pro aminopeptidase|tara:strand:+ start:180 stop:1352 length:1173 start_codon:yes stop_codon:yes gene_type:complete
MKQNSNKKIFTNRMDAFRSKLKESNIDFALITDVDNVYYYTGYYDYLHMEFGRPTILIVSKEGKTALITPAVDAGMVDDTLVDHIEPWNDGVGSEWREIIPSTLKNYNRIGIELNHMPAIVLNYVNSLVDQKKIIDVTPITSDMRMIKSEEELKLARHTGEVGLAMMIAGRTAIKAGMAEYEVALAISNAGTRKSSEILNKNYKETRMSPLTHFLQIMSSGKDTLTAHHRASTKIIKHGDPVFLCFCGMNNFHRFKLGFDRTFWVGEILDKSQEKAYDVCIKSQAAALKLLRAGVVAEEVHAAYADVIQSAGFDYPRFRCGRGTGFSFLEKPELVAGDKTVLKTGMVFSVDGCTYAKNFRAQVGDSVIITDDGYEPITFFPNSIDEMIIK